MLSPEAYHTHMNNVNSSCLVRAVRHLVASLILVAAVVASEDPLPVPGVKLLADCWTLCTGVNPRDSETAAMDAKGVLTIVGGGERTSAAGAPPPAFHAPTTIHATPVAPSAGTRS